MARVLGGFGMKTEVEMELCSICLYQDDTVLKDSRNIRCGSRANDHCPGFKPLKANREGRR